MISRTAPATQGGRYLKRGDTFDPEDWRMTHRLRVAASILAGQGVRPEWPDHADDCPRHPRHLSNVVHSYRESVCCSCGRDYHGPAWPAWATGRLFDLAYQLADEIQTERGGYERGRAYAAKQARERGAA